MDDRKRKRKGPKRISPKKRQSIQNEINSMSLPDLKQKFRDLKKEESILDAEIQKLESQGVKADFKPLMEALHEYNEMKDLTQMVLGYLANVEHCTLTELHSRYNLLLDD